MKKDIDSIGVIIYSFNRPELLQRTLWGLENQTRLPDEIIIAENWTSEDIQRMIKPFKSKFHIKIISQEKREFLKSYVLNSAVLVANSEYLIFTEQGAVPERNFVEKHAEMAREGAFLVGSFMPLSEKLIGSFDETDIRYGNVFLYRWLRKHGMEISFSDIKFMGLRWLTSLFKPSIRWNGVNVSIWRESLFLVNGFNEEIFGGNIELEERLLNSGLRMQLLSEEVSILFPSKKCNLWYSSVEDEIIRKVRSEKIVRTDYGLEQHLADKMLR